MRFNKLFLGFPPLPYLISDYASETAQRKKGKSYSNGELFDVMNRHQQHMHMKAQKQKKPKKGERSRASAKTKKLDFAHGAEKEASAGELECSTWGKF